MADYATKDEVQNIVEKAVNKAVEDLSEVIGDFARQVGDQFKAQDKKIDMLEFRMNERLIAIEQGIINLQNAHEKLVGTVDKFVGRLDSMDIEDTARDSQFEKLLVWAREVSKKTGIPLRDL